MGLVHEAVAIGLERDHASLRIAEQKRCVTEAREAAQAADAAVSVSEQCHEALHAEREGRLVHLRAQGPESERKGVD